MRIKSNDEYAKRLLEEIWQAWAARDMAFAHRLRCRVAGASRGPKKRVYNVARTVPPTQAEWSDLLALPGVQGGLDAKQVNVEQHLEQ